MGGEHRQPENAITRPRGSSPRGRGTLLCRGVRSNVVRFIPAWAGNTASGPAARPAETVHPRVGGEHQADGDPLASGDGSSPRGRGTHPLQCGHEFRLRFIPAWAGNTLVAPGASRLFAVHPRVGGEHPRRLASSPHADGSSPRGRGTPLLELDVRDGDRFIPAWAGNTGQSARSRPTIAVHPRVGGEHRSSSGTRRSMRGSSPRGRGTRASPPARGRPSRFIPAWAGNTPRSAGRTGWRSVHPRVGGEHPPATARARPMTGSSPRGRGTPRRLHHCGLELRFIPAWAGNTAAP